MRPFLFNHISATAYVRIAANLADGLITPNEACFARMLAS